MDAANKNKAVFETLPVPQAVLNMAIPTIVGQLIILFYNMADTFFVGRTNNPLMVTGASLILPVFNTSQAMSNLAGIGGGALISRLLGRGEVEEARRVTGFAITMGLCMATLLSAVMLLFTRPILTFLGAGPDTYTYARQYAFCVIVCGGIPTVLSNLLANLLRSTGESKKAAFGITMGGILNIGLDPLFMYVLMPSGQEILGAGIATCLSNFIACLYFIVTIRRLGPDSVLTGFSLRQRPSAESVRGIFNVGIPSAVAALLFDVDYMVIGRLMTSYGDIQMAAMGIVLKVERLPLNIGIGLCHGMMPLVGYNYSSGDRRRMHAVIRFSRLAGLLCAAVSILLYLAFAPQIMHFFIHDAQTVLLGTDFLRIRSLATPLMFLSFFTLYIFSGFGKGNTALFLGVMRWAVFNIPMLYLLNAFIGMYGIVWSQVTADILTVALSFWMYGRFMRQLR